MAEKDSFWRSLDNAAKIFPAIRSKEHTTVMRLTALLTDRITISSLFKAVERAGNRFPYFKVRLRHGFFWYYLEAIDDPLVIEADFNRPCRAFNSQGHDKGLLRVLVYKNRLSIEFSHILTDGFGLTMFMRAVLCYYFIEKGLLRDDELDPFFKSNAAQEEMEDAYVRFFKANRPSLSRQSKAFHFLYPLANKPRFDILYAVLSIQSLRRIARHKQVSITEYLVAVYLKVIQDVYFKCLERRQYVPRKIARIQVPINLRGLYPSNTMRNFSLFVMPEIDFRLGKYAFDEILKVVYHKMKLETDEKLISKIIARNVGGEKKLFIRGIPLWLKSMLLYLKYYSEGVNKYSGVVTNIGKLELPDSIADKVEYFAITPPPPNEKIKINCGVIGYGDKLVLSFGNVTSSKDFEQRFLHFLVDQGLSVQIKTKI